MPDWNQKVIVVTGGSSGLGVAIARQFAVAGARVVCLARDAQKLAAVAERFEREENLSITTVVADVTNDQSVAEAVATIKETHGQIDGWVNNVGKSLRIALADATVEDFADLMEINFYSAVRCTRAVMPELERSQRLPDQHRLAGVENRLALGRALFHIQTRTRRMAPPTAP